MDSESRAARSAARSEELMLSSIQQVNHTAAVVNAITVSQVELVQGVVAAVCHSLQECNSAEELAHAITLLRESAQSGRAEIE